MSGGQSDTIREQAKILAAESRKSQPGAKIYWFPHDTEALIIEIDDGSIKSCGGEVMPYYFDPAPAEGITVPSGIAIIRPEEFGVLSLPEDWGDWDDAVELEIGA